MATKDISNEKPRMQFAFDKRNYTILVIGIVLLIIGFFALAGGGSKDPNEFNYDLFSTRRMVVAPIILMLGYITVGVSILLKREDKDSSQES